MKEILLNNASYIKSYLTSHFPLDAEFLRRHINHLDWEALSGNTDLHLDNEFISEYEDKIIWDNFCPLNSEYYEGEGNEQKIISFLERYKDKLNWWLVSRMIGPLKNDTYIIDRYLEYWDWNALSMNIWINWSYELTKKYRTMVNWSELVQNPYIKWTPEMLQEFEDEIDWSLFFHSADFSWDYSTLQQFRHRLEPLGINMDMLYYQAAFPEKFKGKKAPGYAGSHGHVNDDEDKQNMDQPYYIYYDEEKDKEYIIYEYVKEYWLRGGFKLLETFDEAHDFVRSLPSMENINFTDKIAWSPEAFKYLLSIPNIDMLHLSTFSTFMDAHKTLKENTDKLIWEKRERSTGFNTINQEKHLESVTGVTANKNIIWTSAMLDEFGDRLNWDYLSFYGKFDWTPELIDRHFDRFNRELIFKNEFFYLDFVMEVMDDELMDRVFEEG